MAIMLTIKPGEFDVGVGLTVKTFFSEFFYKGNSQNNPYKFEVLNLYDDCDILKSLPACLTAFEVFR